MQKLCAKQNRRAKQWATIENFANTSQCVRNLSEFRKALANLARLRIWQCGLRIWQWVANLAKWFANLAKWFAKLAMWFAKLAMRNFAKLLKFYVISEVRKCTVYCG